MPSIRVIAKRAGVSPATVSRVLNHSPSVSADVSKRVIDAINHHGYVPATGRRHTGNIGFLYTGPMSLGSPFDAAVLHGMAASLKTRNWDLVILQSDRGRRSGETYTQMFLRKGIRGVVVRTTLPTRQVCVDIAAEGFPAVVVADVFDAPGVSFVDADSHAACRQAIEHLLDMGHRRIALVENWVPDHDHAVRRAAYCEALRSHGLAVEESLILQIPATREGGCALMRRLASKPNLPTAIFLADPEAAAGVFQEARHLGLAIPGDLSIVGVDDASLRHLLTPRMSAVCQSAEEVGRAAFAALERLMANPAEHAGSPVRTLLSCWYEPLESTGAPPS